MGIVAKYKYDGSVYADLIPEFNAEFTDYTVTDEVEGNIIIRTIESDELPTLMRFGTTHEGVGGEGKSSLLEIIKLDTSNLTSMYCMFRDCAYVTSINTDGWNTSKITDMTSIFNGCGRLTSLDLSNLDTSSAIYFKKMFIGCVALTSIDTSIWKTNKVIDTLDMFRDCTKLELLDISNYDLTNVTLSSEMFIGTENLTDIGMIYCDQSTINKVASLLPTDHNITIWVESDDILQYDQYDHITYKTQKVQDTVHLNSPLLKGDTIEVIDGKTYHVHRWEKVVLNGSEYWDILGTNVPFGSYKLPLKPNGNMTSTEHGAFCDNFPLNTIVSNDINDTRKGVYVVGGGSYSNLRIRITDTDTQNSIKEYLQANPVTVVYELATPYYELISEEPLELTLVDTTDNTINNNSILPSNMTIANKELSTIAIKPSTTYTLSFDKSNVDSEVTIDICGGEQITTVLNRIELTTPSELGSGIRFISSDGCIISNVRLLEGSLVKEAIPKETFEGLKSSFEDGYIIGEVLRTADSMTLINTKNETQASDDIINLPKFIKAKNPITLIFNTDIANSNVRIGCYGEKGIGSDFYNNIDKLDKIGLTKYLIIPMIDIVSIRLVNHDSDSTKIGDAAKISNVVVLEGDHTHLSEAELMRYIEKGTSHYEEEDYNHAGKYKVQYKVTGKNKFNGNYTLGTLDVLGNIVLFEGRGVTDFIEIKSNTPYIGVPSLYRALTYDKNKNIIQDNENKDTIPVVTPKNAKYIRFSFPISDINNIQLEEGEVATEYEPYKEDIKTYYLSSPLLEGDTIEDVNGVATHVKRRWIEKLDGTRDYTNATNLGSVTRYQCGLPTNKYNGSNAVSIAFPQFPKWHQGYEENWEHHYIWNNQIYIFLKNEKLVGGIKQWLSKNPTTLVYELATPIYEPISTEPILLDSYTNGHLDLSNENIPIEKVEFKGFEKSLVYSQPSTKYSLQFNSDNVGIINYIDISGTAQTDVKEVTKGINKINIKTPSDSGYSWLAIHGIGFNASNIQVVATDKDIDFDYFKGLQSSFEDGLVTDENDENYGKYKVECKIVGKNKFNINNLIENNNTTFTYIDNGMKVKNNNAGEYSAVYINLDVKPNTTYSISYKSNVISGSDMIDVYDENNKYFYGSYPLVFNTKNNNKIKVNFYCTKATSTLGDVEYTNIQIEEGTQATSYEPYKESIHTLYLNSPLLKGDKLVVHDGKLCHYHKMGMVMLDGNKDINILDNSNINTSICSFKLDKIAPSYSIAFCDNFMWIYKYSEDCKHFYVSSNSVLFTLEKTKLSSLTVDGWKQWFQQNPTTVVYELAEPYYEPIEPQLSSNSFSTVKDGDMDIITVLPIEKINLTYRTDINGVSSIEEQIASIQEGTDISSIIDEEVDE